MANGIRIYALKGLKMRVDLTYTVANVYNNVESNKVGALD